MELGGGRGGGILTVFKENYLDLFALVLPFLLNYLWMMKVEGVNMGRGDGKYRGLWVGLGYS